MGFLGPLKFEILVSNHCGLILSFKPHLQGAFSDSLNGYAGVFQYHWIYLGSFDS